MPRKKEIVSSFVFVFGIIFLLIIFRTLTAKVFSGGSLRVVPLFIGFFAFVLLAYYITNKVSKS